jgi:hypothetical protein
MACTGLCAVLIVPVESGVAVRSARKKTPVAMRIGFIEMGLQKGHRPMVAYYEEGDEPAPTSSGLKADCDGDHCHCIAIQRGRFTKHFRCCRCNHTKPAPVERSSGSHDPFLDQWGM